MGAAPAWGPPDAPARRHVPMLFLHGVGLGLLPYVPLLMRLAATGQPLVAVQFPHLSMRFRWAVPEVDDVVDVSEAGPRARWVAGGGCLVPGWAEGGLGCAGKSDVLVAVRPEVDVVVTALGGVCRQHR